MYKKTPHSEYNQPQVCEPVPGVQTHQSRLNINQTLTPEEEK